MRYSTTEVDGRLERAVSVLKARGTGHVTEPRRSKAVTAYGQEQDRRRSSEAGFDAHLAKPVSYEDLTRLLGRVGPRGA